MTSDVLETKASDPVRWTGLPERGTLSFAAIDRLDRDAHRALGGKAAVISGHNVLCDYCERGSPNFVRIP